MNRAAIRDAIAATTDFEGVTGTISFDRHGDPIKSVVFMEIVEGAPKLLKIVSP